MDRAEFKLFHPLRVRWAEVDRQGIVFNGNYFIYFDVAMTEYWRAIGIDYPDGFVARYGTDVFAVSACAEYLRPVGFDAEIEVGCRVSKLGRSSATYVLGIWVGDTCTTRGEIVYVNADPATRRSAPWPAEYRQRVRAFEAVIPIESPTEAQHST